MRSRLVAPLVVVLALGLWGCRGSGSAGVGGTLASSTAPSSTTHAATPASTGSVGASALAGAVAAGMPSTSTSTSTSTSAGAVHSGIWLKGDFHVHSTHSGDATWGDDVTGVIKAAAAAGLDFTTISDHRTDACLTDPEFTGAQTPLVLIPGEEWGQPGHAGAHGLTRDPLTHEQDETQGPTVCVQKIQQTLDDVHAMGGIWVLNHAIDDRVAWYWPTDRFDGIEVWNQPWAVGNPQDQTPADVAAWAQAHGLNVAGAPHTPPEVDAAVAVTGGGQNWQRLHLYEAHLASGRHVAAIGGSDSHYVILPGSPTTLVFAEARTKDAVLDAVRKCRTLVQRAPDAPALEFTADTGNKGTFDAMIGDTLPLGHAVTLKLHVVGDDGGKLELVRNGAIAQSWPVTSNDFTVTFADAPTAATWYRVNSYERIDPNLPNGALLKTLVLGTTSSPVLQALASSSLLGTLGPKLQTVANSVVPVLTWLVVYGPQVGVGISSGSTHYPRLTIPTPVSRYMNLAIHDQDFAMSAVTSPIWVQ